MRTKALSTKSLGAMSMSSVTGSSPVKLSERQQDMPELIRKDSFISAQQMSVVLSVVKRTIERDLADLQKKGILIREGNTSAGHWEIIEKYNRLSSPTTIATTNHYTDAEGIPIG